MRCFTIKTIRSRWGNSKQTKENFVKQCCSKKSYQLHTIVFRLRQESFRSDSFISTKSIFNLKHTPSLSGCLPIAYNQIRVNLVSQTYLSYKVVHHLKRWKYKQYCPRCKKGAFFPQKEKNERQQATPPKACVVVRQITGRTFKIFGTKTPDLATLRTCVVVQSWQKTHVLGGRGVCETWRMPFCSWNSFLFLRS